MRTVFTILFTLVLSFCRLFAQDYATGDIIEQDGISYKVLVSYLVVDSKETPDTIYGPENFYKAGEVMVTKVRDNTADVVIPASIGRFKVVGLTDSLFFGHEHDRIWLPDLLFAGNGCFAKLRVTSGALVVHNISRMGMGAFDELDADLIFDMNNGTTWGQAFLKRNADSTMTASRPARKVKTSARALPYLRNCDAYKYSISASGKNFTNWVDAAFKNDASFQENDRTDKNGRFNKKSYSTMPKAKPKKGFNITARAAEVKGMKIPWGSLTKDYYRVANYVVLDKKKKTTTNYSDFIPVADAMLKEGWYVKFVGDNGEVKYKLDGKIIK